MAKLDGSTYWGECNHRDTLRGLKKLLKVLLGSIEDLLQATSHWMELLIAHLLHVQPFSKVHHAVPITHRTDADVTTVVHTCGVLVIGCTPSGC